jgi:hypothetical protein
MVRVLLDACVPHWLRRELTAFDVETAHFAGLDHLSDTELLGAIEGRYDVLVTLDRNLTYQQKIGGAVYGSDCATRVGADTRGISGPHVPTANCHTLRFRWQRYGRWPTLSRYPVCHTESQRGLAATW